MKNSTESPAPVALTDASMPRRKFLAGAGVAGVGMAGAAMAEAVIGSAALAAPQNAPVAADQSKRSASRSAAKVPGTEHWTTRQAAK